MIESKKGFIKLNRSEEVFELLSHHKEFILLTQIALRARRTDSKISNLEKNQALIGDFKNIGLSRQSYRSAISNLQKWGFITIHPTNKGTVATITGRDVYDINNNQPNHLTNQQPTIQPTSDQPSTNQQPTTNKNIKKDKKEKNKEIYDQKFDLFWSIYPKRNGKIVGKKITKEIFNKLKIEDLDRVIKNAENYGIENLFAKDPQRFLQNDFWKDWDEPVKNNISKQPNPFDTAV